MSLTRIEKEKLYREFDSKISRIVTKMIPSIKMAYADITLIDLLMSLPIKFDFTEYDLNTLVANTPAADDTGTPFPPPTREGMAIGGYITRDTEAGNPDRLVVFFNFHKDVGMTWDEYFDWVIESPELISQAAFTYLHEALHILNRHYDFYLNQKYISIIKGVRNDMDENQSNQLLNHAYDYWINAYLIEKADPRSHINKFPNDPNFAALYDANLSPENITQQELVRKLAREADIKKRELLDSSGNRIGEQVSITINGNTSTGIYLDDMHDIAQSQQPSIAEQEIGEVLDSTRQQMLDKTMGSGSSGAMQVLGVSYEVPIDWFASLKSSIFTIVQKYTNNSEPTWSRLKNKFRHIAPMPGRIHYDKQLAAVISIDQSGSMSNDDLRKINYVVTELAKKATFVEILLHDTRVAAREKFTGHQPVPIERFITTRAACGGTSHAEVFKILGEIKEENPKTKLIYLSFSDNYSDINSVYTDDIFNGVIPYWITTDERNPVRVPGMQISLENGLLQI